jgi:hypothetical protein
MVRSALATVTYSQQEILRVLRDLEMMIVSLDRIGAATGEGDPEESARITTDFLDQWQVFKRLAEARQVLSEPFADDIDADGTEALEQALEDVPCWSATDQTPPNGALI